VVTIRDVAAQAGVSIATVSRVLAGQEGIREAKRIAVLEACERLDYQRDAMAASLRGRSTSSVGILVPDITNPFFPAVVQSAERELADLALDIVFCESGNDVQTEAARLRTLLRRRVDALLACPVHATQSSSAIREAAQKTRIIQLDRMVVPELDFVGVDHAAGMRQVAAHLIERGAKSALFVGLNSTMPTIMDRAEGFVRASRERSLTVDRVVSLAFPDRENGREFARELLRADVLPDAIACANDEIAAGILLEMRAAGVTEMLLTGYDDVPFAEIVGLTTVRQPLAELGREAARMLGQGLKAPRHIRLHPELVARETTVPGRG
jgi:LacI family transcriptional regulator